MSFLHPRIEQGRIKDRLVLQKPAEPISLAEMALKQTEMFYKLDSDGSGSVSKIEFEDSSHQDAFQRRLDGKRTKERVLGNSRRQDGNHTNKHRRKDRNSQERDAISEELFNILDTDNDSFLSREEFRMGSNSENRELARRRSLFTLIDKDSDGELSITELAFRTNRMRALDEDGDGMLSIEELRSRRSFPRQ